MSSDRAPQYVAPEEVASCRDAKENLYAALKQLNRKKFRKGEASEERESLVDGIVNEVEHLRQQADACREMAKTADKPDVYVLLASRYDEMVVKAQLSLMDMGVKAANNEQQALDRRVITRERIASDERHWKAKVGEPRVIEDAHEKIRQRIAAMQSSAVDAQFEPRGPHG